jgi:hypothetical protein
MSRLRRTPSSADVLATPSWSALLHRAVLAGSLAGAVGLAGLGVSPAAAAFPGTNGKIAFSQFTARRSRSARSTRTGPRRRS